MRLFTYFGKITTTKKYINQSGHCHKHNVRDKQKKTKQQQMEWDK